MNEKKERETFERRIGVDRRKKRFGRRGPKWLLGLANWLTSNPNAFYLYMILSMASLFYTIANLAYNLNQLILGFFKGMIR